MECRGRETILWLPGGLNSIRFPNSLESWDDISTRMLQTCKAVWMLAAKGEVGKLVPDLVIPYTLQGLERPIFERLDGHTIVSHYDLPASVLFSLSRAEEIASNRRDEHGRFPLRCSTAFRDGFLNRPVVDEYGFALDEAIEALMPLRPFSARRLRVKLSHDCDEVGLWPSLGADSVRNQIGLLSSYRLLIPSVRAAVAHTTYHGAVTSTCRELVKIGLGMGRNFLQLTSDLAEHSRARGIDSAFYWKGSSVGAFDSGYDPRSPKVASLIDRLRDQGFENGVHPGYETFLDLETLRKEVEIVREATGEESMGGRQHYLRWVPDSWHDWERCGLAYDSSVGWSDCPGFRAGTCIPYHPWLQKLDREAQLLEIPLVVMETALFRVCTNYEQALELVESYVTRCRKVGGLFTFHCHNGMLAQRPGFVDFYQRVLDLVAWNDAFDWRSAKTEHYQPDNVVCNA